MEAIYPTGFFSPLPWLRVYSFFFMAGLLPVLEFLVFSFFGHHIWWGGFLFPSHLDLPFLLSSCFQNLRPPLENDTLLFTADFLLHLSISPSRNFLIRLRRVSFLICGVSSLPLSSQHPNDAGATFCLHRQDVSNFLLGITEPAAFQGILSPFAYPFQHPRPFLKPRPFPQQEDGRNFLFFLHRVPGLPSHRTTPSLVTDFGDASEAFFTFFPPA